MPALDLTNTEVAFSHLNDRELERAYWLFRAIGQPWIVQAGPVLADWSLKLRLPVQWAIRATVFAHFCGGDTIESCEPRIAELARHQVGTILDFARERGTREEEFDEVRDETLRMIDLAADHPSIPYTVFKPTAVASLDLLAKRDRGEALSADELAAWQRVEARFETLCRHAARRNVRILIDAEESWIQASVDELAQRLMRELNQQATIVYTTAQMYRHDRLAFLERAIADARAHGYGFGVKLVRGAYLEKERDRAQALGYPSPLNPTKEATDRAYDDALRLCVQHVDRVALVAGTHNEQSVMLLTRLMAEAGLAPDDRRVGFAQLLGMSDHISYNLAAAGYNVAKYVPYGTVREALPYLTRRAQENSAVAGQTSRELSLLQQELERRRRVKAQAKATA